MQNYLNLDSWVIIAVVLWTLPWKGVALWKAGKSGHKGWFVSIFLTNTLAILDILYLFVFSKKLPKNT